MFTPAYFTVPEDEELEEVVAALPEVLIAALVAAWVLLAAGADELDATWAELATAELVDAAAEELATFELVEAGAEALEAGPV